MIDITTLHILLLKLEHAFKHLIMAYSKKKNLGKVIQSVTMEIIKTESSNNQSNK